MVKDDIIHFGGYAWRVLEVTGGRALVITEQIIALRWYHTGFEEVTWAGCDLRRYLNHDFYNRFSSGEKAAIITVTNHNPDNPWFKTAGGPDTADRVFLLSLEEVCRYFGDSTKSLQQKGSRRWQIADEHNAKRQARYGRDFHWWRLRSPGYYARTAASVSANGDVYVRGNGVYGRPRDGGGVRPALWLRY